MSADDVLSRATRAARAFAEQAPADPASGRARLLAAAMQRRRTRRTAHLLAPAMLGVLVCSTAWAAATGRLPIPSAFRASAAPTESPPSPPASPHAQVPAPHHHDTAPTATTAPTTAPSSAPTTVPMTAHAAAPRPAPATPAPTHRAAHAPPSPTPVAPPPSPGQSSAPTASADAPAEPPEADALYAAAHRAHFVARDPAAALRAWDAYLAAAPSGRYAPEARYNRAISLVRLGLRAQARAALAPFAAGAYGGYRQRDARMLLDALDAR